MTEVFWECHAWLMRCHELKIQLFLKYGELTCISYVEVPLFKSTPKINISLWKGEVRGHSNSNTVVNTYWWVEITAGVHGYSARISSHRLSLWLQPYFCLQDTRLLLAESTLKCGAPLPIFPGFSFASVSIKQIWEVTLLKGLQNSWYHSLEE